MFQVPRDMADVPVPDNARGLWGCVYGGKINTWYNQNRTRTDLWPGKTAETRGFNSLKAILGKLYGLDIRYYVKVDFAGFRNVVDTVGGVQVNVQMPVYESEYPAAGGYLTRIYIPAGPQHMTGSEALRYARSRHRAAGGDFDRGRRQQRVLLSLKEQMSVQAIIANLPQLVRTSEVRQDRHPDLGAAQAPRARGERGHQEHPVLRVLAELLRHRVRELPPRLHHHAQRRADPQGGQGGLLHQSRARR